MSNTKIKSVYTTVSLISAALAIAPLFIILLYSTKIQSELSGIENISFLYGLSNPLPALVVIFGSLLYGTALGLIISLPFYIYLPEFKQYEKIIFRKSIKKYPILQKGESKKFRLGLFLTSIVIVVLLSPLLFLSFNDYVVANEDIIREKYLTTSKEYYWKNIQNAEIKIEAFWDEEDARYTYGVNAILYTDTEEIYIWKDNGLTKPKAEQIIWLFDKLKRENIPFKIESVSNDILMDLYENNIDFKERVYPILDGYLN